MGFFGMVSTLIAAQTLPGQKACVCALMQATEGLRVGCGGMGGWVGLRNGKTKGFIKTKSLGWVGLRNGWMGGFKEWVDGRV